MATTSLPLWLGATVFLGAFLFSTTMHADTPAPDAKPLVRNNIAYLGPGRKEMADVYTPPGDRAGPFPAVLLIHGGGWVGGDKADARGKSISSDLADAGYVVFAINYRLAKAEGGSKVPTPAWPQNFYDCKSALRFMRKQATELGIDPARIAVMGESAGGHLALLVGSTAHVDELNKGGLYTDQSNDVSCIINFYGVPDLAAFDQKMILTNFKGATDAQTAENIRRASPCNYLDAKTPPILIVHGTKDTLVPVETSRHLADQLKQLGASYQYVQVAGAGHSFDLRPKQMDLRPAVFGFLKRYLGQSQKTP